MCFYRGNLLIRNSFPNLGPPKDLRYSPAGGSEEGEGSYERDTPVLRERFPASHSLSAANIFGVGSRVQDVGIWALRAHAEAWCVRRPK